MDILFRFQLSMKKKNIQPHAPEKEYAQSANIPKLTYDDSVVGVPP